MDNSERDVLKQRKRQTLPDLDSNRMNTPEHSPTYIQTDSNIIFECLNKYIGNENEIQLRRCSTDMVDIITSTQTRSYLYSGSYAEGFRLHFSDRDFMTWYNDTKAVCEISQINTLTYTNVLLMDTRHCWPGFSLLNVLSVTDDYLKQCVTSVQNDLYFNAFQYKTMFLPKDGYIHGPCCKMPSIFAEIDLAYCIKCDQWPAQASEFITRSTRQQWPSISVLDDIINNGCHLVPVGARFSENENLEWRISFSLAEKKLIFSFNHTQFLCYGLLKLVLSQIINKKADVSDLICSYFLKTVVFWEIQENPTLWLPGNILTYFWNCFGRLISWVNTDYCPNFFIPENNMFCGKLTVKQQRDLVKYLQTWRNEGVGLFYRIPNLMCVQRMDSITPVSPMCTRYKEFSIISYEISAAVYRCNTDKLRSLFVKCLSYKQQNTALAPAVVLDITLNNIVTTLLLREVNEVNSTHIKNKDRYKIYRSRLYPFMRYLSSSSPCSRLYLATVLYTVGQYNKVLHIVTAVQSNLQPMSSECPLLLNDPNLRKHLCLMISFSKDDHLNELIPELISSTDKLILLRIPPLLYIKWLVFMCYHHMKDRGKCKQALEDLHMLLFEGGIYVPVQYTDLTYNMVGMCYELYGDHQNALLMYRESMKINGNHCTAAACRLGRLLSKLSRSS